MQASPPPPSITPKPSPAPSCTSSYRAHVAGSVELAARPHGITGRLPSARVHRTPARSHPGTPSRALSRCRRRYAACRHRPEQYLPVRPRAGSSTRPPHSTQSIPRILAGRVTTCTADQHKHVSEHQFAIKTAQNHPKTSVTTPAKTAKTPPDQPISPLIGCYSKKLWNPYRKPPSCTWSSVMLNGACQACREGSPPGVFSRIWCVPFA